MIVAAHLITALIALAPVELRSNAGVVDQPVDSVSVAGVRLDGPAGRVISWDRVRSVEGPRAAEASQFADLAERAWRARVRLGRGDAALAEPLFESLMDEVVRPYHEASGPTGLVVADGLLRCRLARGQPTGAVEPWLWAARLAGAGIAADSPLALEESLLCPSLPPVFLAADAAAALAESSTLRDLADHRSPAGALAAWTRFAAAHESGLSASPPAVPGEIAQHPGVALVGAMALARAGDAAERTAARAWLDAGLAADAGTWREAWRRAAIGRSFLMEPGDADRARGLIELLHVPARFSATQPHLASLALAEVIAELRRSGDTAGAQSLERELRALAPRGHALRWLEAGNARNPSADAAGPVPQQSPST